MDILKQKFSEKAGLLRGEIKTLLATYGEEKVDEVTLGQVYGGARGIISMIWEPSLLDPIEGIRFRGYSIPALRERLPKWEGDSEPMPEGLFWLLLTGEIPGRNEVDWLCREWQRRADLPGYVTKVLNALPLDCHPMTQFSIGINAMQPMSVFARRYESGMSKEEFPDATYEDTMNLVASLPLLAAYIYRRTYHGGDHISPDLNQDWSGSFARQLGLDQPAFKSLMRLYLTIHADHEGGNASAHTTHLVGSTLSDPYLSLAAGMNALAGPLHGLANQEVIGWILEMVQELGTRQPSEEAIGAYVRKTLASGQVVPGYGHAVLRKPDPRFIAQMEFAQRNLPKDDLVGIVWKIYQVVPPILESLGKVKNPWPNVDAHSGALLMHFGLKEHGFYTVLFGVSRALGVLASSCWSRALGFPLERPKSVTTEWVKEFLRKKVS